MRVSLFPLWIVAVLWMASLPLHAAVLDAEVDAEVDTVSLSGVWALQVGDNAASAAPDVDDSGWERLTVPGTWGARTPTPGFVWLRTVVEVPWFDGSDAARARWARLRPSVAVLGEIGNAWELFAGGARVGGFGVVDGPLQVTRPQRVLGFHEGATENARACKELLGNLQERGLPMDRSTLVVIDGSKALRKAIGDVFGDRAVVQRCQVHKRRNVLDHLPESKKERIGLAMNQAYRSSSASTARKLLLNLARSLEQEHPSTAASLQEGLDETLTVKGLRLPAALSRSLSTTNPIENIQGGIRRVCTRWRGGAMVRRWVGAALVEHSRGFRRMKGCSRF